MFSITSAQLKMFSGVCANLMVLLIAAIPITRDPGLLTWNILGAMLCWKMGILAEEKLEEIL